MTREEAVRRIHRAAEENLTQLDLAGLELEELPPEIGKCTQLETLVLGKVESWMWSNNGKTTLTLITNQLRTLPEELRSLLNLRSINLSGNPFGTIPELLREMKQLEILNLTSIGLTDISKDIDQLFNLTELVFQDNQITQIPDALAKLCEALAQLSYLTKLDLSYNQIAQIPDTIGQLSKIRELDLSHNQINEIPDTLDQLPNLKKLNLGGNQLAQIPDELVKLCAALVQLPNLLELDLSLNQIISIPEVIGQLSNLTDIDLRSNQIISIPEVIGQLSNLTRLRLSYNQITSIPEVIGQLWNLTEIDLSYNQIISIPAVIGQLSNLTRIRLRNNQITSIPEVIGQLSNLTQLHLDLNLITSIPEVIGQLSNLTHLYLSNNQITQIPKDLGRLSNLKQLGLSSNLITSIPEELAQLSNLTLLDLRNNQITVIPEAIAQLSNLTELNLGSNRITAIPECLETLPKLEKLDLRRNPLPISPEILGPANEREDPGTPAAIFNYLQKLRSGEVRPLNEAKVLLVGQGSVGKTSLINRLIRDKYNRNESQTDGLNITDWQITVNTKSVKLNVWDFGGQEIYHATHQFFLTKRSLYVLVCNCRISEDENRLEYWLKLIESFGDASPVIIVGNKCDEQPLDLNRKALRDKYPNIKAILETSCESAKGIEELRSAIHTEISELKEVYDLLPLSWFQVKQSLETLDKDFINMSEYASICGKQNIWEETDKTQLLELLHNLGIVLNFREHPILQSTNILNPHWVTEGIYALLSDEHLKVNTKGILTHDDLSRILDSHKYPRHRYNCLTELMQEFQLCFPVSNCPAPTFLIPGILPKEQPENTELEGETLEFQYHYDILPDSIVSRFIVLTHDKIHDKIHWRTGVMLAYCERADVCNIARIKSDPKDRKIFISVSGRESTRRSFLTIIRDMFSKIHNSFANLEVSQWVPVPGHPDADPLDYEELLGLEDMGENTVRVGKLKLKLDLRQLLDGYDAIEVRRRKQMGGEEMEKYGREYGDLVDASNSQQIVYNVHLGNNKMTQDSPQNNNLQGAQIGSVAIAKEVKDNAKQTASGGIQINNANTAEILQLILSMRETAAQFPEDIRDGIILDIEAVEAEIKKPEKERDNTRLKTILKRIVTTGIAIGVGVAGVTDFANTAIDVAQKVGVKIELPSGR
ncbi:COR domain-containing protein [Microcoleus sp. A2-C5]|uniref:leucine-rich repeat domain-containing protein n=1 Tax=unclassified Microcoleus TaxID=2642155 RepID=UPI002FCEB497